MRNSFENEMPAFPEENDKSSSEPPCNFDNDLIREQMLEMLDNFALIEPTHCYSPYDYLELCMSHFGGELDLMYKEVLKARRGEKHCFPFKGNINNHLAAIQAIVRGDVSHPDRIPPHHFEY